MNSASRGGTFGWALLTIPLVMFLLLFLGFPALLNLLYSVSDVSFQTLREPRPTGLGNYFDVLVDGAFWQAASFSLRFGVITALIECTAGLFLAVFLAPLLAKRSLLITGMMLPLMVAPALVGLMYRLVLHEFVGPLPYYLLEWTGDSPAFLAPDMAFRTLVAVETLQWTPFAFLLFHVAYGAIPQDVIDAAAMDGASIWQRLRFVDLPLMLPTVAVAFLIRLIDGVRVFDIVYVLTGSGAGGTTQSLSIYIYETFFRRAAIGKAVAASVILFMLSFFVIYGLSRAITRRRHEL